MKWIDYEDQLQFVEECLVVRYGIMPDSGVYHDKKSWRGWWHSKKTREEIKMSMDKNMIFLSIH